MNKLVCIETHRFCFDRNGTNEAFSFYKDEITSCEINVKEVDKELYGRIRHNDKWYLTPMSVFMKYFIPLSEYRNKQIESILNEE